MTNVATDRGLSGVGPPAGRGAFTMLELVVVVVVVGILLTLLLPAVQQARESARTLGCQNNLRQWGLGLHQFESSHGVFPPGVEYRKSPQTGDRASITSFIFGLLPYVGEAALYESVDLSAQETDPTVEACAATPLTLLACPSEAEPAVNLGVAATSYAFNWGTGVPLNGYDGFIRPIEPGDFRPFPGGGLNTAGSFPAGLSHTAAMSEWLHDSQTTTDYRRKVWVLPVQTLDAAGYANGIKVCETVPDDPILYGWKMGGFGVGTTWVYLSGPPATGYEHALTPGGVSCAGTYGIGMMTANSLHPAGVNLLYADGRVTTVARTIDAAIWRKAGSRLATPLLASQF